jgi:hypothetical protein
MQIRDRVSEFRRVRASLLRPNPRNWRKHPAEQHDALRGILSEVGFAGALLARRLDDGTLELIDGHLRAETTPEMEVPVLVLDLTREEADKLLAVHDPIAGMAEADEQLAQELASQVATDNAALARLLSAWTGANNEPVAATSLNASDLGGESYQVVVECRDEAEQRSVFERLHREGFACRVLTL